MLRGIEYREMDPEQQARLETAARFVHTVIVPIVRDGQDDRFDSDALGKKLASFRRKVKGPGRDFTFHDITSIPITENQTFPREGEIGVKKLTSADVMSFGVNLNVLQYLTRIDGNKLYEVADLAENSPSNNGGCIFKFLSR